MGSKIITLMFHRVYDETCGFDPKKFATYLDYLIQHFPIVTPGDPLIPNRICVCLTFDDAYYDFYHYVYPLLKQHYIRAILAVPVKFIREKTELKAAQRLALPVPDMNSANAIETGGFCTWSELQEMAQSDRVVIASHGFAHTDLTDNKANSEQEIQYSKQLLQDRLQIPIRYFVYPFGRFSRHIHHKVCEHYEYGIRIGSSLNNGWDQKNRIIYRIDAEKLWMRHRPLNGWLVQKISLKYWGNRLRRK